MTGRTQIETSPWRCPICRGTLTDLGESLRCDTDHASYEVIDGIPDLRHPDGESSERAADRRIARERSRAAASCTPAETIRALFASREGVDGWTAAHTLDRTRRTLAAPGRFRREIEGWLRPCVSAGTFLDVGCGLGGLLAGAAAAGKTGIGIDNKMDMLVVAKRVIEAAGGQAILAAADAESLPLDDGAVSAVTMCDVVEHIDDLPAAFSEASRVTKADGMLACAIPNRFSLGPEPHIFVWGVGWLPRRYQKRFVRWRTGRSYDHTRLPSAIEIRRLLRRYSRFKPRIRPADIPPEEIAASSGVRAALAKVYNALLPLRIVRPMLIGLGPSFQLVAAKDGASI